MIGECKVVINGLGASYESDGGSGDDRIIGKLLDGIHRIVSADVDEAVDLELIEHLEDLLVKFLVLIDIGELITAGSQISRRCSLKKLRIKT